MGNLVQVSRENGIARIVLNRPELNNALNPQLIDELRAALNAAAADSSVATVVLSGEGKSLCAGADINRMREAATFSREDNIQDALPLSRM